MCIADGEKLRNSCSLGRVGKQKVRPLNDKGIDAYQNLINDDKSLTVCKIIIVVSSSVL